MSIRPARLGAVVLWRPTPGALVPGEVADPERVKIDYGVTATVGFYRVRILAPHPRAGTVVTAAPGSLREPSNRHLVGRDGGPGNGGRRLG